jgi:hypothetical protein
MNQVLTLLANIRNGAVANCLPKATVRAISKDGIGERYCQLYHFYDSNVGPDVAKGYVGITTQGEKRINQHLKEIAKGSESKARWSATEYSWCWVAEGTLSECLQLERLLRPTKNMPGVFNVSEGGVHDQKRDNGWHTGAPVKAREMLSNVNDGALWHLSLAAYEGSKIRLVMVYSPWSTDPVTHAVNKRLLEKDLLTMAIQYFESTGDELPQYQPLRAMVPVWKRAVGWAAQDYDLNKRAFLHWLAKADDNTLVNSAPASAVELDEITGVKIQSALKSLRAHMTGEYVKKKLNQRSGYYVLACVDIDSEELFFDPRASAVQRTQINTALNEYKGDKSMREAVNYNRNSSTAREGRAKRVHIKNKGTRAEVAAATGSNLKAAAASVAQMMWIKCFPSEPLPSFALTDWRDLTLRLFNESIFAKSMPTSISTRSTYERAADSSVGRAARLDAAVRAADILSRQLLKAA